jgi:hypothetical protein
VCGFVQRLAARAASSAARGALAGIEPDGSCRARHTVVAIVSVLDGSAGVQRPAFSSIAARPRRPPRRARDADGVHRTSLAADLRRRCAGNSDQPRQTPSRPWRTCTRQGDVGSALAVVLERTRPSNLGLAVKKGHQPTAQELAALGGDIITIRYDDRRSSPRQNCRYVLVLGAQTRIPNASSNRRSARTERHVRALPASLYGQSLLVW